MRRRKPSSIRITQSIALITAKLRQIPAQSSSVSATPQPGGGRDYFPTPPTPPDRQPLPVDGRDDAVAAVGLGHRAALARRRAGRRHPVPPVLPGCSLIGIRAAYPRVCPSCPAGMQPLPVGGRDYCPFGRNPTRRSCGIPRHSGAGRHPPPQNSPKNPLQSCQNPLDRAYRNYYTIHRFGFHHHP